MRQRWFLPVVLAAAALVLALGRLPSTLAYTGATVRGTGQVQAGQGTALLACSVAGTTSPNPITRPNNGTTQGTAQVTCTNNLNHQVTFNIASSLSPSPNQAPTVSNPSVTVAAGGVGSGNVTVTVRKNTVPGDYTISYTASVSSSGTAVDWTYSLPGTTDFTVN